MTSHDLQNGMPIRARQCDRCFSMVQTLQHWNDAHLLGATNVSVPGMTNDLDAALASARRIATAMHLPLHEEPRSGFFGKRL